MNKLLFVSVILAISLAIGLLVGCGKSPAPSPKSKPKAPTTTMTQPENPVAPEKKPPGDIPDTQAFVTYKSASGKYSVEAPEGWARSENGADIKFTDKFNGEMVTLSKTATPPTVSSVQQAQVPVLKQTGRAVQIQAVNTKLMLHGQTVVFVTYTSNSDPDSVTGKKVRLDNITYYYYHKGTLAALTVWAPSGADNVDQWKRISESFRWF